MLKISFFLEEKRSQEKITLNGCVLEDKIENIFLLRAQISGTVPSLALDGP